MRVIRWTSRSDYTRGRWTSISDYTQKNCMKRDRHTYILKNWGIIMDNGCVIRTKNHETSKVVGFLGMSVGCPDKIHLCWKKCIKYTAAQWLQIAKTRQKLNFENSWNRRIILVSATVWQIWMLSQGNRKRKSCEFAETRMKKLVKSHQVNLFLAYFSHLKPQCGSALALKRPILTIEWWSSSLRHEKMQRMSRPLI